MKSGHANSILGSSPTLL